MRRSCIIALVLATVLAGAQATAEGEPDSGAPAAVAAQAPAGCAKAYSRATFHKAARRSFVTFPYTAHEQKTLKRVIRCQRSDRSRRIVRRHLDGYKAGYRARFRWHIAWAKVPAWLRNTLGRIAACESGGNPRAVDSSGTYYGRYQFDFKTWGEVGGRGNPAAASAREQDVRAAVLYRRAGKGRWPVCGV